MGSQLYVATVAGWGALPTCVLRGDVGDIINPPYTMSSTKVRGLTLVKPSSKYYPASFYTRFHLTLLQRYPRETLERGFLKKLTTA